MIETPRNSREKYDYDEKTNSFLLKKLLPAGMCFPYDFGFIPDSKGEDGDPLDALVISEFGTFPGCCVQCRLIGAIKAEQTENGNTIRNDRFLFVPEISMVYKKIRSITNLPHSFIGELVYFFINYNQQQGREYNVLSVMPSDRAKKLLKHNLA